MNEKLQIEDVFEKLAFPASKEDQADLESRLLNEGCLEPIITWRGIILDGHKRFKFCTFEGINFEVKEIEFESEARAVAWVCRHRIGVFDKSSSYHRYLLGKCYAAQKIVNRELRKQGREPDQKKGSIKGRRNSVWDTRARVAEALCTSTSAVETGDSYAKAMDMIKGKEPALFEAILRDDIHLSFTTVMDISSKEGKALTEFLKEKLKYRHKTKHKEAKDKEYNTEKNKDRDEVTIKTGIKEMPAFDPDMEIRSLMFTIPTWINMITRVEKKTDLSLITDKARGQLMMNLGRLKAQIDHLVESFNDYTVAYKNTQTEMVSSSNVTENRAAMMDSFLKESRWFI